MAKDKNGLHAHQRALRAYIKYPTWSAKGIARVANARLNVVYEVMKAYDQGRYTIPIVDGEPDYSQAKRTSAPVAGGKKLWEHEEERKKKEAEEKQREQEDALRDMALIDQHYHEEPIEQYDFGFEKDPDERKMDWYAVGVLSGILGTAVTIWLAEQIAG